MKMRDEPWDAPIPDEFEPDQYYAKKLAEHRAEYRRVLNLSEEEAEEEVQKLTQEYWENEAEARIRHNNTRHHYDQMIEKVEAWEGAPEGIKEFALEQLRSGREFDVGHPFKYYGTKPDADPEKWRKATLEQLDEDIMYHAQEYEKEVIRTDQANAWVKKLKESLND